MCFNKENKKFIPLICKGLHLYDKPIIIPWKCNPKKLNKFLQPFGLKHVTKGYYYIENVQPFADELKCDVGFHYNAFVLQTIEINPHFNKDQDLSNFLKLSYTALHKASVAEFGNPHKIQKSTNIDFDGGYTSYYWKFGRVKISHYVMERFGLEMRFQISK